MSAAIFIDGEAGTTGLQIGDKLAGVPSIETRKSGSPRRERTLAAKQKLYGEVDVCDPLPARPRRQKRQRISLTGMGAERAAGDWPASSAHRVVSGWTYGLSRACRGAEGRPSPRPAKSRTPVVTQPARLPCCAR